MYRGDICSYWEMYQTLHIKGERGKFVSNIVAIGLNLSYSTYTQYLHAMIQEERYSYIFILRGEGFNFSWRHIYLQYPVGYIQSSCSLQAKNMYPQNSHSYNCHALYACHYIAESN